MCQWCQWFPRQNLTRRRRRAPTHASAYDEVVIGLEASVRFPPRSDTQGKNQGREGEESRDHADVGAGDVVLEVRHWQARHRGRGCELVCHGW